MKRLWPVVVFAIGTLFVLPQTKARAQTVQTFTTLTDWQAAVGSNQQFSADFSSFTQDTYFQAAPVNVGPFSLLQLGQNPLGNLANFIDVPPLQFGDNSGVTNAAMYTKSGVSTVIMTFNRLVFAWGANFYGAQTSELVNIVLTSSGGKVVATVPVTVNTGFFGFVLSPADGSGSGLSSITFQSQINNPDPTVGQGFGLENVVGGYVPPEFNDVAPTSSFFDAANLMFLAGVTNGCVGGGSPNNREYCPNNSVTRDQMAAFIVRAVTGTLTPAIYTTTPYFTDVTPSNPFFPHIQKLRDLGITTGCAPSLYCPGGTVPRWQMAIFMIRARLALYGASFTSNPTAYFADVSQPAYGTTFPFIQRAYEEQVTAGCASNPRIFCPNDMVTRGQMASFIMRALFNQTMVLGPTTPYLAVESPNAVAAASGSQISVTITGVNTNFQAGDTVTVPSGMLAVSNVVVNSATSISATLTVNANAVPGPQALVVTTGGMNLTWPMAVQVGTY